MLVLSFYINSKILHLQIMRSVSQQKTKFSLLLPLTLSPSILPLFHQLVTSCFKLRSLMYGLFFIVCVHRSEHKNPVAPFSVCLHTAPSLHCTHFKVGHAVAERYSTQYPPPTSPTPFKDQSFTLRLLISLMQGPIWCRWSRESKPKVDVPEIHYCLIAIQCMKMCWSSQSISQ